MKCPACGQRISSLAKVCQHCSTALGTLDAGDLNRLARQRWRRDTNRAANVTYLGLAMLMIGAIWWFGAPPQGWFFPPPIATSVLVPLGLILYLAARSWLLWLRLPRNRPPPD